MRFAYPPYRSPKPLKVTVLNAGLYCKARQRPLVPLQDAVKDTGANLRCRSRRKSCQMDSTRNHILNAHFLPSVTGMKAQGIRFAGVGRCTPKHQHALRFGFNVNPSLGKAVAPPEGASLRQTSAVTSRWPPRLQHRWPPGLGVEIRAVFPFLAAVHHPE